MPSLAELKASSPAYASLSDDEFAQRVYERHYADRMSFDDFSSRVGVPPADAPSFGNVQSGVESTEGAAWKPYTLGAKRPQMTQAELDEQRDRELSGYANAFSGLPAPVRGLVGAGERVGSTARGVGQVLGVRDEADEATARRDDAYIRGDTAARVGGFGADLAMLALPASRVAKLPKLGQYAGSAGLGAATGFLQPVIDDESRVLNTAVGTVLGPVGQGASNVLQAVGRRAAAAVPKELRNLYNAAKARGITLTPAQLSSSDFVKRFVAQMDKLPFSGATGRKAAQQTAVNREAAKLIGQKTDTLDDAAMGRAYDQMGQEYDQLLAGGGSYDRQFLREIAGLRKEAAEQMDDTAQRTIGGLIKRVRRQGVDGALPGRALQSLDQQARRAATGGGDRQLVAQGFKEALGGALERTAPAGKREAIRDLNRRYATFKTLEPLVARKPEGGIPSEQILGAVNATQRGRARMARGEAGELGLLAKIGQQMKGPSSSGTTENLRVADWRNPLIWPLLGLEAGTGASVGRLANSGLLSDYLMRAGRGQARQAIAPYARTGLLAATPGATAQAQERRRKKRPKRRTDVTPPR